MREPRRSTECLGHVVLMAAAALFFFIVRPSSASPLPANPHTVKTIQSEDGDVIDCVEIDKQPAFNHPLLKDHRIQMKPTFLDKAVTTTINQTWRKNEECPRGTVPILRTRAMDDVNETRMLSEHLYRSTSTRSSGLSNAGPRTEFAGEAIHLKPLYGHYGSSAIMTIWPQKVEPDEWSTNTMAVGDNNIFLEAGYGAFPGVFSDDNPRFYVNFAVFVDKPYGCMNELCPGFVHVSTKVALGAILDPVSTYGGEQYYIKFTIRKDAALSNWWVIAEDEPVGYWPATLFPSFTVARNFLWGGGVLNTGGDCFDHTTIQMGSGAPARTGPSRAGLFQKVTVVNVNGTFVFPEYHKVQNRWDGCYSVDYAGDDGPGFKFFYGGTGGKGCCTD